MAGDASFLGSEVGSDEKLYTVLLTLRLCVCVWVTGD